MKLPKLTNFGTAGFTGTREGITGEQEDALAGLLSNFAVLRHGSCVGADQKAHEIVYEGIEAGRDLLIVIHPPTKKDYLFRPKLRGLSARVASAVPKEYHERNRDIVDLSDFLLATPRKKVPKKKWKGQEGGTWYTINYAIKVGKPVAIIWPDGTIKMVAARKDD